eukprot:TRINITY_DN30595_c0_g1_i1.p1 TRINITY_DN30595_c0_g1~~TRINITY_DN30595_c0_g1_i1.p1  ORF type:complete len:391 (-),score=40.00 TRINITY_DN30595_c0_g1_i1:526-1656(-)
MAARKACNSVNLTSHLPIERKSNERVLSSTHGKFAGAVAVGVVGLSTGAALNTACSSLNSTVKTHLLSGCFAGVLEILLFHPVDTATKRLIVYNRPAAAATDLRGSICQTFSQSKRVVLGGLDSTAGVSEKVRSLYSGVGFALIYKIFQRGYQYTAQPLLADALATKRENDVRHGRGPVLTRPAEHAVAGALMGCGEVMLLPLDSLKVKRQTHKPLSFRGSQADGYLELLRGSYRGTVCTATRNSVGSFTLFGGAALVKEHVLKLEDPSRATPLEHFLSSSVSALLCILVSAPFDVIKTRVQRQGGESANAALEPRTSHAPQSGRQIAWEIVTKEGLRAFFKGSVPKCAMVGPKLMFTYTVASSLHTWLSGVRTSS